MSICAHSGMWRTKEVFQEPTLAASNRLSGRIRESGKSGPLSNGIIEDVYRVVQSLKAIYEKKGGVIAKVPRSGHRAIVNKELRCWGGRRVRRTDEEILADQRWTHPEAKAAGMETANFQYDLHHGLAANGDT